mmetsp:Transcript_5910/g.24209  ORF Transcript_5910/g.24209 Transcript_5910/m.24209 type:complete len:329 (+) Transcript_5910:502-1488(+)
MRLVSGEGLRRSALHLAEDAANRGFRLRRGERAHDQGLQLRQRRRRRRGVQVGRGLPLRLLPAPGRAAAGGVSARPRRVYPDRRHRQCRQRRVRIERSFGPQPARAFVRLRGDRGGQVPVREVQRTRGGFRRGHRGKERGADGEADESVAGRHQLRGGSRRGRPRPRVQVHRQGRVPETKVARGVQGCVHAVDARDFQLGIVQGVHAGWKRGERQAHRHRGGSAGVAVADDVPVWERDIGQVCAAGARHREPQRPPGALADRQRVPRNLSAQQGSRDTGAKVSGHPGEGAGCRHIRADRTRELSQTHHRRAEGPQAARVRRRGNRLRR